MEIAFSPFLPDALLLDLPEVDAQHEEVFTRIESLKAGCFESSYVDIDEFQGLIELFERHFATEERIAREAGVNFSRHATIHRNTLDLLRKALSDILAGSADAHSFLRYAEFWFERHIRDEDKRFVAKLQGSSHFDRPSKRRSVAADRYSSNHA